MLWIIIAVVALIIGVYVGLGLPGLPGREDRVVPQGRARRLSHNYIHWYKPRSRR